MSYETQLWAWFLFASGLPTSRAKHLLDGWQTAKRSLTDTLAALPGAATGLGLTAKEARILRPPATLPPITALRWDEPPYPTGLRRLPLDSRPALLFYRGDAQLLRRPLIYLQPVAIPPDEHDIAQETLGLLLGESFLVAATHGSDQAALLLAEMADSEGEILLFARCGLEQLTPAGREAALLAEQRLLLVSALPPATPGNPRWDTLLTQVEAAAALRCLVIGSAPQPATPPWPPTPTLYVTAHSPATAAPATADPTEALLWLMGSEHLKTAPAPTSPPPEPEAEPAPPPEETLRILAQGGHIPNILRERLQGQ
ncbi:MAG: hypothetical protein J7M17_02800 [Anaerolineae bacterium]|nr:hypothetical protein [Anaerolineae bacterium]